MSKVDKDAKGICESTGHNQTQEGEALIDSALIPNMKYSFTEMVSIVVENSDRYILSTNLCGDRMSFVFAD